MVAEPVPDERQAVMAERATGTTGAEPGDRDEILDLITAEQADPARGIPYLGTRRDGIEAELADLTPAWTSTVRLAREGGRIVGVALAEWDPESDRAWIFGPWVAGDDARWHRWARPLVDAAAGQVPPGITDRELSGDVANERIAALGAELGWPATLVNHVFVADREVASDWPADDMRVRPLVAGDLAQMAPLHEQEFPRSYASADQLPARAADGSWTVLVAEQDGVFLGYAAGRVQPDGEGYLDFVAVTPEARGLGAGQALVTSIGRRLVSLSPAGTVNLTVQDPRLPARRLYEKLGFRLDASIRGYRSKPADSQEPQPSA